MNGDCSDGESDPEFGERAFAAGYGIGGRKADVAHALEDLRGGGGAADVPVLVGRVGSDDEEVVGGGEAAVASTGREDEDVAGLDGDGFPSFAAEDEIGVAGSEAEDLVRGGVVVVEGVDAVAPLRRPAVGGEEALHLCG